MMLLSPPFMNFFNLQEPIVRRKQPQLDIQDLRGLIYWRWRINQQTVLSWLYTRIDQVFLLWGCLAAGIFLTPQFLPGICWAHQAIIGTSLSVVGLGLMTWMVWFWVRVEGFRWLIYLWSGLVLVGLGLTDYGVFAGIGAILSHLCALWLGVCLIGYGVMGVGMRSRTFLIVAGCHGAAIPFLQFVPSYQFLTTAIVISGTLFLLAEVQWDMRPPVLSPVLSAEENAFNQAQYRSRCLNTAEQFQHLTSERVKLSQML